jgi:hypothetical protein
MSASSRFGWSDEDLGPDYTKDLDAAVRYLGSHSTNGSLWLSLRLLVGRTLEDRTNAGNDAKTWVMRIDDWSRFQSMADVISSYEQDRARA